MDDEGDRHPFEVLEGHRYARLTTFRKSGQPVSSPVWFALAGDRVFTDIESGKVKRIRNDPRAFLELRRATNKDRAAE